MVSMLLTAVMLLSLISSFPAYASAPIKWDKVGNPQNTLGTSTAPLTSLCVDGGIPYIAYIDDTEGAVVKKLWNNNWTTVGAVSVTSDAVTHFAFEVYNGTPYFAYVSSTDGHNKVELKKYDSTYGWVTLNSIEGAVDDGEVALHIKDGIPYVAYVHSGKIYILPFNVDEPAYIGLWSTQYPISSLSLTSDEEGNFYLAYQEGRNTHVFIKPYGQDYLEWPWVGNDVSESGSSAPSLYVYHNTPYIAYSETDSDDQQKTIVKRINGEDWETVGGGYISQDATSENVLYIDADGTIYVAYADHNPMAKVWKLKNNTWVTADNSTNGYASETRMNGLSLAVDNGIPYVSYVSYSEAMVMRYTPPTAPSISEHPAAQTVETGQPVSFTVTAQGTSPLYYQWLKNGVEISGAIENTLTFDTAAAADQGSYTCEVSNSVGSIISHAAALTVTPAVDVQTEWKLLGNMPLSAIPTRFTSLAVSDGITYVAHSTRFGVIRGAVFDFDEAWNILGDTYLGEEPMDGSLYVEHGTPYFAYLTPSSDAIVMKYINTTKTWQTIGTIPTVAGDLSLYVHDEIPYLTFTRSGYPLVAKYDEGSFYLVGGLITESGSSPTLRGDESGNLYLSFLDRGQVYVLTNISGSWDFAGATVSAGHSASDPALYVYKNTPYVAYTDQSAGKKCMVKKLVDGEWVTVGSGDGYVSDDLSAGSSLFIDEDGTPYIAYESGYRHYAKVYRLENGSWQTVSDNGYASTGKTSKLSLSVEDGIPYLAFADEKYNDATAVMWYKPADEPSVSAQPTNQTVTAGETATFSVTAKGAAPLTYQWLKDGNAIAGATGSTLTLTNVQTADAGRYACYISNSAGNITSDAATLTVNEPPKTSGGGSSPGTKSSNSGANILVNGKTENAGILSTKTQDGKTITTVAVDPEKLEQKLAAEGKHAVVTIPVSIASNVVRGELDGAMVKSMESKQAVIEVKTKTASYTLPAEQININAISNQLGKDVKLGDIKVQIEIAQSADAMVKVAENAAQKGSFTLIAAPVDFTVTCTYRSKTVSAREFTDYVKRIVTIPDGVDPSKITTGVVIDPDGTVRHMPTEITVVNGQYYAVINSLTNSTYGVVWHPLEFKDVVNHWAKDAVNDMGSRMVIDGIGNGLFEPNRDITRAEFAAIVVRGLGLKPGTGTNTFTDVSESKWYSGAIETAAGYGLIAGYGNDTFGPMDKITREQAMTMAARAMKITGLEEKLTSGKAEATLASFGDADKTASWAKDSASDCIKAGIIAGKNGNILAPKANITRAEVAAIISRLLKESDLINK